MRSDFTITHKQPETFSFRDAIINIENTSSFTKLPIDICLFQIIKIISPKIKKSDEEKSETIEHLLKLSLQLNRTIGLKEILYISTPVFKKAKDCKVITILLENIAYMRELHLLKDFINFLNKQNIEEFEEKDIQSISYLYRRFGSKIFK